MKKLVSIAILLGFATAGSLGLLGLYSHLHGGENTAPSNLASTMLIWVWPTVLLIPLDVGYNAVGFVALGISVIANAILYGAVALGIALVQKNVFAQKTNRDQSGDWWPSNRQ